MRAALRPHRVSLLIESRVNLDSANADAGARRVTLVGAVVARVHFQSLVIIMLGYISDGRACSGLSEVSSRTEDPAQA